MTKERIKELRHAQNFAMGLRGLKLGLRECLDAIEQLQHQIKAANELIAGSEFPPLKVRDMLQNILKDQ